ncbi:VENN motif pre-toxin domain-containing protein [Pseudomonas sp. SCB32]|uniref:VENN motif pre-toxin domain-containing protein n=1 Tax=Pseudomonas sp. SCB32 TaxID=2653853 RepID=UPI0015B3E6FD|nr:VENN motif pre-toxin domain-containing protein [Pseudomonas sp. SCB32]
MAIAGAAGAATGELIAASLYPNKSPQDLTESERQIVSALSTLAAGIAGGLATGDSAGAVAAAGAGKTAVENNFLSGNQVKAFDQEMQECTKVGDCQKVIEKYVSLNEENRQKMKLQCEKNPVACADYTKDLVKTGLYTADASLPAFFGGIENENVRMMVQYENGQDLQYINNHTDTLSKALAFASQTENFMLLSGGLVNLTNASTKSIATGVGLGMVANGGVQLATGNTGDKFDWVGFMASGVTGGMSAGQSLTPTVQTNMGGAYIASQLNGQNSVNSVLGAAAGSALGFGLGSAIAGRLEGDIVSRYFGLGGNSANALKYSEVPLFPGSYLLRETSMSAAPGISGGIFGGMGSEYSNYLLLENLKNRGN